MVEVLGQENVAQQLVGLLLGVALDLVGVVLDKIDEQLVQTLLLVAVEHYLVDALPEETLAEPAHRVPRVRLIQDLDVVLLLQALEHLEDLAVRVMPQGANVLQHPRAEDLPDYRR